MHRRPPAVLLLLLVLALTLAACRPHHATLGDLVAREEADGWLLIGRFGDDWPACVTDQETAEDRIRFSLADGTSHEYSGFDGYRLKVVRLQGENGQEVVVVFRSRDAR